MSSKNFLCLALLLLGTSICKGQSDFDWQQNLVLSLVEKRNEMFEKAKQHPHSVQETIERLQQLESNRELLGQIIFGLSYMNILGGYTYDKLIKKSNKIEPKIELSKYFSAEDLYTLVENHELVDYIRSGIIGVDYPYKILPNDYFFKEMAFYQLKPYESIAEIGAGTGLFSELLTMTDIGLKVYVNELNYLYVDYMRYKKNQNMEAYKPAIIQGSKKSVNLPAQVDKIIIRNTFHHFSKKEKMLESIKASLVKGGKLYINEVFTGESEEHICSESMKKAEFLALLSSNGFELVRTEKLEVENLFEFVVK